MARVPCLPASIDVCLAVWEQFWCDRAGLFCGSLAFHRVRRRRVRRGPPRGKTYAYPEGYPQRLRASKRVSPHGPVHRRRRCFGRASLESPSAGAVSLGEEWSRPQLGRSLRRASVSSRFLLSSRTPSRTRCTSSVVLRGSRAGRNLVDPASSHMLVSKIKPCMSQYKLLYGETANGSLKQL